MCAKNESRRSGPGGAVLAEATLAASTAGAEADRRLAQIEHQALTTDYNAGR